MSVSPTATSPSCQVTVTIPQFGNPANHHSRAVLLTSDEAGVDVHTASEGRFGPDLPSLYSEWEAFSAWAQGLSGLTADVAHRKATHLTASLTC